MHPLIGTADIRLSPGNPGQISFDLWASPGTPVIPIQKVILRAGTAANPEEIVLAEDVDGPTDNEGFNTVVTIPAPIGRNARYDFVLIIDGKEFSESVWASVDEEAPRLGE